MATSMKHNQKAKSRLMELVYAVQEQFGDSIDFMTREEVSMIVLDYENGTEDEVKQVWSYFGKD